MERSGKYTVYKKMGALQASVIPPTINENGFVKKEGAVLLEMAPGVGEQKWDWDQKLNLAIGIPDLCKLLEKMGEEVKLVHVAGETSKTMVVKPGVDKYAGTYVVSLHAKRGQESKSISVPLSGGEYELLVRMITQMAPTLIGWQ